MALRLVTPPDSYPVSLEEAKAHLRVDTDDDDTLISSLIETATGHIDGKNGWLQRALKPQTYELVFDRFPCGPIAIPMRPLLEVESVKYDDEDGNEQSVNVGDYAVDIVSDPGWVVPIADFSWPDTVDAINAVRVRFTAGYADLIESESGADTVLSTVPRPIKHAILIMVADLFEYRESVVEGAISLVPIPATAKALLHPYRVFT